MGAYELSTLPFFQINNRFQILDVSQASFDVFPNTTDFLELVDLESIKKVRRFLTPDHTTIRMEANMRTRVNPLSLFEMHVHWESPQLGNILLMGQDSQLFGLAEQLELLRVRLMSVDFALVERKEQLEAKLKGMRQLTDERNLQMIGQVAEGLAHEIRNPLTFVRGFVQLLQPDLQQTGQAEVGQHILREIDKINDVIFDFINYTNPPAPRKERVDMQLVLDDAMARAIQKRSAVPCEVYLQVEGPIDPLWMDRKQITHVVEHVLKNAYDAVQEISYKRNGLIYIDVRQTPSGVEIVIRDNGCGMNQETIIHLFRPFFTTKEAGIGLGLMVSKQIVTNHFGSLDVYSERGKGTTIRILLPINMMF